MLTLTLMIANGAPDAPPAWPSPPRTCTGCEHLAARTHPAGTAGPHGTSARCKGTQGGSRVIGWQWHPDDLRPGWCPKWRTPA